MVAKQCHSRLKLFGVVNHREKRYEPSFSHDRVSLTMSSLTASTNTSPCVQSTIVTPPSNKFDKPLWRRRRATGPGMMHLPAATLMSTRELSTSSRTFQYDPPSGVSRSENRKLFFDTHAVVRLFEDNGFTTQQAEVMVKVLVRMTNSTMDVIYNDMVTKVQQEIMLQHVMSQIVSVKKDMIILEKSEFSTLLAENEKLKIQLLEFRVHLSDDMNKVRSQTMLDMNLEKSRMKEMKADHDRKLMETRTGIMEMSAEQDRHLTQTDMKIDTEVAGLKTMLVAHKLDTIKYLAGSVFTCLTVALGFYRIWM